MSATTEHEMATTCTTVWLVQPKAERVDVDEFPLTPCPDWCDPQRCGIDRAGYLRHSSPNEYWAGEYAVIEIRRERVDNHYLPLDEALGDVRVVLAIDETPLDGQLHLTPADAVDMAERVLATVHEIDPELVERLLERHLSVGWSS